MSLLEERIKRMSKNRPPPGTAPPPVKTAQTPTQAAVQSSPESRSGIPMRGARPTSAYFASDNKNTRAEPEEKPQQPRPASALLKFADELEQAVQEATGYRSNANASIHVDLIEVNLDDIYTEAVPLPRFK